VKKNLNSLNFQPRRLARKITSGCANGKFLSARVLHGCLPRLTGCDFKPWRTAFLDYLYEPIEAGVNLLTERLPNAEAINFSFLSLAVSLPFLALMLF
jgi:hypothetical protein